METLAIFNQNWTPGVQDGSLKTEFSKLCPCKYYCPGQLGNQLKYYVNFTAFVKRDTEIIDFKSSHNNVES